MKFNGCRIRDSTYSMNSDLSTLLYSMLSMYTYIYMDNKHKTQTTTSEKKEHATHMRAIIYDGVITHPPLK